MPTIGETENPTTAIPELSNVAQILYSTILSCCLVSCFAGNGLVLLSLKRYPNLRTPANAILGSLALADLLTGLTFTVWIYNLLSEDFGGVLANIQAGVSSTLIATASLHIALISIDRFVSIRYALRYLSLVTMTRVLKLLALVWSSTLTIVGLVAFLTTIIAPNSDAKRIMLYRSLRTTGLYSHSVHPLLVTYKILVLVLFFGLPFAVIFISYAYVAKIVHEKKRTIASEIVNRITMVNAKGTKTLFIVFLLYSILNMPYVIVTAFQLLNTNLKLHSILRPLLVLASLAPSCNPFMYAYRDRHFKQAFRKILSYESGEFASR
ncbi:alpha-1B adrenergic receptor-like [Dendronephthya gigantea]|uniref:alpha-1B adrenergic receptor-like n=1 Tax=Dendronephthya gigantea TaxID=151771 RepID=UPI00106A5A4C|nr:alpha-1B adrenergic receptor-like [Dendronephthya gigantea]